MKTHNILKHITDIVGLSAIVAIVHFNSASPEVLGAIVSIALGKRYAENKLGK